MALFLIFGGIFIVWIWTIAPIEREKPKPNDPLYGYDISWTVRGVAFGLMSTLLGIAMLLGQSEASNWVMLVAFFLLPVLLAALGILILTSTRVNNFVWHIFRRGTNPSLDRKWLGICLIGIGVIWLGIFTYLTWPYG